MSLCFNYKYYYNFILLSSSSLTSSIIKQSFNKNQLFHTLSTSSKRLQSTSSSHYNQHEKQQPQLQPDLQHQPQQFLFINSENNSTTTTTTTTSTNTTITNRMSDLQNQYTILADDSIISKPINDDRNYRFFKLNSNDLKVLVINDPGADKSAASLDVNVGSFNDKIYEISGLAHFCEHLLFMGTSKYPKENEYSNYLSKHSGNSNAYTSSEHTNYYFQISSNYLEGALDRFSQFFISPLFSKTCENREINAVDSENKKNLQNDNWRLYQLDKLNSNLNHPYNGFSTGNYYTLHDLPESKGVNVRDTLLKFYNESYSSNIMSLVILGKEDLDTLSTWAIEKFSSIPNKNLTRPNYQNELVYDSKNLLKLIKAKPVKNLHQLEISFMIPDDLENKWDSKPQSYFSHLLGHESEGSILNYLKLQNWVTELSSGNMNVCQGNSIYMIEFQLTPLGLKNWEKTVEVTFQYLNFILLDEPQKWIWEEIKNISEINFKFKQKSDVSSTVSKMSNSLYKFDSFIPPNHILNSTVVQKFDPIEIKKFGSLLNPNNFRLTLVSPTLTNLTQKEPWYGTEYVIEDIPKDLLQSINSPKLNPLLHYPKSNEFIPTNFEISKKKQPKPQISPHLINHDNKLNVWYKQDDQFEIPKGSIEIIFHLPNSNTDVISSTKSSMFIEMLDDRLNQITYYASLVGLRVNMNCWRDGFAINVSGYNHKLSILLKQVLEKFFNFKPDHKRFESLKFKLLKEFKNFGYQVPYYQIGSYHLNLVNEKVYDYDAKIKILENLKFEEIEKFIKEDIWKSGIFGEVLIHGNFDISNATEIKNLISKHVDSIKPMMNEYDESVFHLSNHILSPNENLRYEVELKDDKNVNSCIEYYLQISNKNDLKLRVFIDLLSIIIREPCFDRLRTKEQLGYVVFSGLKKGRTSLGFRILIQSEKSCNYLEYRIDEFLNKFGEYINNELTDEEFNKFKTSLIDLKLIKLKHLNEETNKIWNSITDGYYDFDFKLKHVKLIEKITKTEFINFFNDYIKNESGETSKLIIYLNSQIQNEIPESKRIGLALNNYAYHNDFKIDHEFIDSLVKEYTDVDEIVEKYTEKIKSIDSKVDKDQIFKDIKISINQLTPSIYPTGKLIQSIDEFKSNHKLGEKPIPVTPLSKFFYEQSHL
ncbi:STE23 [Candida pseudojiufengensis]|uniref:STE23 n=1 Tax=Candida pseudojiufengensis TaxID=497109 RepID=UPI0022247CD3|nr:STE23 [Candida pseudojiufengensis]KAI5965382.1 STE23 [Candida pseudojiufengensis]